MGTDQAPMALRLSGQLLLGVARIYSRKTKYLLEDCNEALVKIKVFDANNRDSNLLALDVNTDIGHSRVAAFNAITVPDAMTEFDLLLPAQTIDISGWGLNPKTSHLSDHRELTFEQGNDDTLLAPGNSLSLDHGRRGLDIELGRNYMNRIGGRGYNVMDFDLAGPDDALDLDIFGDDLGNLDFEFARRPGHSRRDDLEIEVGRRDDSNIRQRSTSVDPFGMDTLADEKQRPLRLGEGSDDGRAPSVHGSVHDPAFDDLIPTHGLNRDALHFDLVDGEGAAALEQGQEQQQQQRNQRQPTNKKRKLVVDEETEMSQEHLTEEGLLTAHEMLPRSRKLLRLQQIEQDVAHGGLAGYLLDFTAGPRVMGGALVPELASMFSRRLQLAPEAPPPPPAQTNAAAADATRQTPAWQPEQVESWMDHVGDNDADFGIQTTPPPPDRFDGFRLDSPRREDHTEATNQVNSGEGSSSVPRSSLFQDEEAVSAARTKELLGTVFSTSAVRTMRLVQHGLEERRKETGEEAIGGGARSTRTSSVATASSAPNKGNMTRVTFEELMEGGATKSSEKEKAKEKAKQKGTRTDAAKLFFELLVLSTKDVVKVEQETSFGEIKVGGSPWLETLVEADASTLVETEA
ncbi:sister chromatid cohesion protein 1 [Mortierella sp. GBA43]|nr:sister chromatid cohesion protein 1 [Mortierella sp. GBA43]